MVSRQRIASEISSVNPLQNTVKREIQIGEIDKQTDRQTDTDWHTDVENQSTTLNGFFIQSLHINYWMELLATGEG